MDNRKQREGAKGSELEKADISATRSGVVPIRRADLSNAKRSGSKGAAKGTDNPFSRKRRGTGPRTMQGKTKSKQNALKHGIFSSVVLLPDESQAEFNALLNGLRSALQPEGPLEEVLVDKIATVLWRNRRLVIAEGAEIRKGQEFIGWDGEQRELENAANIELVQFKGGLMRSITNPIALERCLDLLEELKMRVEKNGFDPENDKIILGKLYGHYNELNWQQTLFYSYSIFVVAAGLPEEERQQKGVPSPQECKDMFLKDLKEQIKWLDRYKKDQTEVFSSKLELESLRQNVPDAPQLDRLLRYEASLERGFDRTLSQLERLQRMRLGHPVPPSINLNVSAS